MQSCESGDPHGARDRAAALCRIDATPSKNGHFRKKVVQQAIPGRTAWVAPRRLLIGKWQVERRQDNDIESVDGWHQEVSPSCASSARDRFRSPAIGNAESERAVMEFI